MPSIYISKHTRQQLDTLRRVYITEKQIAPSVAHIITDDVLIRELIEEVKHFVK